MSDSSRRHLCMIWAFAEEARRQIHTGDLAAAQRLLTAISATAKNGLDREPHSPFGTKMFGHSPGPRLISSDGKLVA